MEEIIIEISSKSICGGGCWKICQKVYVREGVGKFVNKYMWGRVLRNFLSSALENGLKNAYWRVFSLFQKNML